jgi:hypothetical protein
MTRCATPYGKAPAPSICFALAFAFSAGSWEHNGKNSHDLNRWGKRLAEVRDLSENAGYARRLVKLDSDYLAPRKTAEHATLAGARRDWLLVDALALLLAALVLVGVDAIASVHN